MSEAVQTLVPVLAYQQSRAHIFSSIESLRWFMQRNRSQLADTGAIMKLAGRIHVAPDVFDNVVMAVGKESAQRIAT